MDPDSAMRVHVLIVSYPAQGQINPLLRLGKALASIGGFLVTFSTTSEFGKKISVSNGESPGYLYPVGHGFLRFDYFDVEKQGADFTAYLSLLELAGRKKVPRMISRAAQEGLPVSCLINGTLVPWVCDVAGELGIPCATMWAQSCASFLTFYHCYNELVPFPTEEDPYIDIQIPTLPLLKWDELHSFLDPIGPRAYQRKPWLREFGNLNKSFCILIDTFDELEPEIIDFSTKLCSIIKPVGPLFKLADPTVRGDPIKADFDCLRWLDSKPLRSVVYICFGSNAHLKQEQIDEIAHGVLNVGLPFLWVMKPPQSRFNLKPHTLPNGFLDKAGDDGRVVAYAPQEQVLQHPTVMCFMTHCGWNSTMEGLTSGVPMLAFPQWGDQFTDAKFLVDVFGVAVRMARREDQMVSREEVDKCIREVLVGPKAEKMRTNALAIKDKAHNSSYKNLHAFVKEITRRTRDATTAER